MSLSLSPELAVMVMAVSLPVASSLADTLKIPFASMSNVTLILGMPRGAGMMSDSLKRPRVRFCFASARSPCSTWISTCVWLSSAVE